MPVTDGLTQRYLQTLQLLDLTKWNSSSHVDYAQILWRDGESVFLIPDGIEREEYWLEGCLYERGHISSPATKSPDILPKRSYPVHPFSAWSNEMSMLWFIRRVEDLERGLIGSKSSSEIIAWLNCINSDILAAVEKSSPRIELRNLKNHQLNSFLINRSDRGFEGEAMLVAAEQNINIIGSKGWQRKALAREQYISELL